jgi:hypothetical protein
LKSFGKAKEIQTGMIAVLHTWGQNLSLHPHLHCIVPGGGVDKNSNWKNIRGDGKFLFPVKALSKVFRANIVRLYKRKAQIIILESRNNFGRNSGSFLPKSLLEALNRWWNI